MTRRERWLVAAVLAAGLAARVHGLGAQAFWIDEFLSLFASSGHAYSDASTPELVWLEPPPPPPTALETAPPWWAIWRSTTAYSHPPLYFLLLRAWRELFGSGEAALRSLSVLASLVALLLLYDVARALHGIGTAVSATTLMAIAPPQVLYAQEARGYALALAFCLASASAMVRIVQRGVTGRRLIAMGFFSLAAMLTHYYSVGPLAGFALYGLSSTPRRVRKQIGATLLLALACFVAAWGPFMWRQRARALDTPWLADERPRTTGRLLARVAAIPLQHITATTRRSADGPSPWLVLVPLAAFAFRRPRPYAAWWLSLGVTAGMVAGLDAALSVQQLTRIRYTLAASPATYVLLAAPLPFAGPWLRHGAAVAAIGIALWRLPDVYLPAKPEWRQLGAAVGRFLEPGSPLLIPGEERSTVYASLATYADLRSYRVVLVGSSVPTSAAQRLRQDRTLWVLSASDDWRTYLGAGCTVRQVVHVRGAPRLWRVERRRPPPEGVSFCS